MKQCPHITVSTHGLLVSALQALTIYVTRVLLLSSLNTEVLDREYLPSLDAVSAKFCYTVSIVRELLTI